MREIKFRAWHEENHAFSYVTIKDIWINGWHVCEALKSPKPPKDENGIFTKQEALENFNAFVPNADWEQFTGLKDKNGVEIYEGDIMMSEDGLRLYQVMWNKREGRWYLKGLDNAWDDPEPKWYEYEQTGKNIHENPELLK